MSTTTTVMEKENVIKLRLDETVLVCLTCKTPVGGAGYDDNIRAAYDEWVASAEGQKGYTESFWFALYEPASTPQTIMFGHLFDAKPDGLQAANAYKHKAVSEFSAFLKTRGFAEIGEQQHLLYKGGSMIP